MSLLGGMELEWMSLRLMLLVSWFTVAVFSVEVDPRGYIVYCPCMGRFGNQADQFLGSLEFSRILDRTLVLPHWIEYPKSAFPGSEQVPFDRYFKVESLQKYHRVILMDDFMRNLAPNIWPPENRTVLCYRARNGRSNYAGKDECFAKDGNPFGPFWTKFDIDFVEGKFYEPLRFDAASASEWNRRFPPSGFPVLAFTGAPGSFPVTVENARLHHYLDWSDYIRDKGDAVISAHLPRPYIAAHLRIGSDWANACSHISDAKISTSHLFASAQCLGSYMEYGKLTMEMCLPSKETITTELLDLVKVYKAKSVFLARDDQKYDADIKSTLNKLNVAVHWLEENEPHVDLYILGQSDHYIGNCISTFSGFATRERNAKGLKTSFWASTPRRKDEL